MGDSSDSNCTISVDVCPEPDASGMVRNNRNVLVVCGPSGSGKSTLLRRLFEEFPDRFGFSVSHTTRGPRPGETDGKHYHFVTRDDMERLIEGKQFIEHAEFAANLYGTSQKAVEAVISSGKTCVLDIDVQGVQHVKKAGGVMAGAVYVFVKPPSIGELESRLRGRGTETEDSLTRRLDIARRDLTYGDTPGNFHLVLVNDSLDKSYTIFKHFVLANTGFNPSSLPSIDSTSAVRE
uniref:guanylate kinase n=1 Tax=Cacopsylla melanoneura TaxID=428564 RepID=A0A8D8UWV0_9HEMI